MNLPPLRTAAPRPADAKPVGSPTRFVGPADTPPPTDPTADLARLPLPARGLLAQLLAAGLLDADEQDKFLRQVGDHARTLTTRERAADALVHFSHLTKYQRGRALAGQLDGLRFGPYRVLDRAGAGTVGVVFKGEHAVLRRAVAVKVTPAEHDPGRWARYVNEARALAAVSHPHVVAALDAGTVRSGGEDLWYLAMEWAGGGDLEAAVYADGAAGIRTGCRWGWQAAAGLHAAHAAGLVHRDVKPSNLLRDDAGAIKVADFGLVKRFDATRTPVNALVGSLQFLAPEQLNDPTAAGPPADAYSLAVTLFWAMSGKLPYPEGAKTGELLNFLRTGTPHRLKQHLPDAPAGLDDLFAGLMSRNPADRPTLPDAMAVFATFAAPAATAVQATDPREAVRQVERELADRQTELTAARQAVRVALLAAVPNQDRAERLRAFTLLLLDPLGERPHWTNYRSAAVREEVATAAALIDLGPDVIERVADRTPASLPFLRTLRQVAGHVGERWDAKGPATPPAARAAAVADEFEKRTADPTADPVEVLRALVKEAGTRFDPDVIAALKQAGPELCALALPVLELVEEGERPA